MFFLGCAIHDANNGLRCALLGYIGDPAMLKAMYIIVASIRQSYDLVIACLGQWLPAVVVVGYV